MKKKNIKEEDKRYPAKGVEASAKNTQLEEKKGNTVFPYVGEPQTLFLEPIKVAPPLGTNFKIYVAMLFRKKDCKDHLPTVGPDTPEPKRSFTDDVPAFQKTESISFMGSQKLNLYDHRFDQSEAVRQEHFEKFKGKLFAKTTIPPWGVYRYFSALLLNILMERIASIQRGVPDMEDAPKPPGNQPPKKTSTAATPKNQKAPQATPGEARRSRGLIGAKNNNKIKVEKNPEEAAFLAKKLRSYQRRRKVKEKTKLRGLVRWNSRRHKKVGRGYVFLESQEAFDFKYNFTAEAHRHRANLIRGNKPKAPLSFYDQFLKKKFKIPQFGMAVNPKTGQVRFFFRKPEYRFLGHHLRARKAWWFRKSSQKFKQFYRFWEPLKSRFRVRYKFLQRRISVLFVILKKLYRVSISKTSRLWFSKIKFSSFDGVWGLEEFFRVFESRLFIVLSRFLIFQKKKKFDSKQLILAGLLQVNGMTVTNPFYVVPSFSFIKLIKSGIKYSRSLKRKVNLNPQQKSIKILADSQLRPMNKDKNYIKRASKPLACLNGYKKKLKFMINRNNFFNLEGASASLVNSIIFNLVDTSLKIKNKKYMSNKKKLNLCKKVLPLLAKIKARLKMVFYGDLSLRRRNQNKLSRLVAKVFFKESKLSACTVVRRIRQIKKKKNLLNWWSILNSFRGYKSYKIYGLAHKKAHKGVIQFLSLVSPKIQNFKFLRALFNSQKKGRVAAIYKYRKYFMVAMKKERQISKMGLFFKKDRRFFKKFKFIKYSGTFKWKKKINVHHLLMAKRNKKKQNYGNARTKRKNNRSNKVQKSNNRQIYKQSRISRFAHKLFAVARKLKKQRKEAPKHWQEILEALKKKEAQKAKHLTKLEKKKAKAKTLDSLVGPLKELMELRAEQNRLAAALTRAPKPHPFKKANKAYILRPHIRQYSSYLRSGAGGSNRAYIFRSRTKKAKLQRLSFLVNTSNFFFYFWKRKIWRFARRCFFNCGFIKNKKTTVGRRFAKKNFFLSKSPLKNKNMLNWYKKEKVFSPYHFKNFFRRTIVPAGYYYNSWTGYLVFNRPISFLFAYLEYRFSKRLLLSLL